MRTNGHDAMVTTHLGRGKTILIGLVAAIFSTLLGVLVPATPAHAASAPAFEWVDATTIKFGGSALKGTVNVTGSFVGNVFGTPPGSQTFMAVSSGPIEMSFGCKVSMTLNIYPDAQGKLNYGKGDLIFTTSQPSTCSQDTLRANINGLVHDPKTGTANISLNGVTITGVDKRGPAGGNDDPSKQTVNVTATMGPASDYTGIPQTDTFMLCEAKGDYTNNVDQLYKDCLAKQAGALSAQPITSNSLESLNNGKGPNGSDEKVWTGKFTGVKPGIYVACSANFKACQLFTKNPGQDASVTIMFGSTPGSTIPGTPPGQGAPDEKVCTTGDGLAGALAWVLCPAVQLIASATNFFENNIIVPFMTVSPLTTNADNPIYILWQSIRNVANIGFIVFFFFVIFSQATSIGLSNYGIKKILPKMAIVVIGVNLSYFIVAFIIDAFNIFGAGISALVTSALQQAGTTQLNNGTSSGAVRSIFTLGGAALLTIVVSGGSAIGWFFSFLGLALLVVVVVVIVLVVRQMAIIMLVIVSPAAILMYMLPNTEGYFTKWRKTLIQLLMMYPMIVLLFAAGKIFGIILQQPDFKIAGDGVSDDVAQAVRVILQFVVYVVPLVFLPATFAASGSLMGRIYGGLSNRFVQPRAQRLKEDASQMGKEAQMRMANNRILRRTGVAQLAGRGLKRDYVRSARQQNLQREQQEYVAGAVGSSAMLRRQAAGVSGQAGQTRAAAYAANVANKGRNEDIDAEMALLNDEMRNLGVDQKTFAAAAGRYLEKPDDASRQTLTGANGRTFNFKNNESRLQRALLNSAASQGEIKAIEAARLNNSIDQTMVDDIIRRNDGKLKEKGGYHLATDFKLANGRQFNTTTAAGRDTAQVTMQAERIKAMAQSGANSIAGMKAGLMGDTAGLLTDPASRAALHAQLDAMSAQASADATARARASNPSAAPVVIDYRAMYRKQLDQILGNSNTLNRSETSEATFRDIRGNI